MQLGACPRRRFRDRWACTAENARSRTGGAQFLTASRTLERCFSIMDERCQLGDRVLEHVDPPWRHPLSVYVQDRSTHDIRQGFAAAPSATRCCHHPHPHERRRESHPLPRWLTGARPAPVADSRGRGREHRYEPGRWVCACCLTEPLDRDTAVGRDGLPRGWVAAVVPLERQPRRAAGRLRLLRSATRVLDGITSPLTRQGRQT